MNESKKLTLEEHQALKGLYCNNPVPNRDQKISIAKILSCDYDRIEEWFLRMKILNRLLKGRDNVPETTSENVDNRSNTAEEIEYLTDAFANDESVEDLSSDDEETEYKQGRYTSGELKYLTDIFAINPSPKTHQIIKICQTLNRNVSKIYNWFRHMRKKHGI